MNIRHVFRPRSVAGSGRSYDRPQLSGREIGCCVVLGILAVLIVPWVLGIAPWYLPVGIMAAIVGAVVASFLVDVFG